MWIELLGTGAAGAISVATAVFYSYKVRVAQQEAEEKEKLIEVFKAMRTGDTESRYIQETFEAMCRIFGIGASAAKREIEIYVESIKPYHSHGRSVQRKMTQEIMLGTVHRLDRWLLRFIDDLEPIEKENIDQQIRHAFHPIETWNAVTKEYGETFPDILALLHGFDVRRSNFYMGMGRRFRTLLENRLEQSTREGSTENNHDYLREEMDRLKVAKQLEQEMLIEFTTLVNHIEAEVEAERLRFEVDGLKMNEWKIGYAEVIEKAATMRGIPFEAKTKHDYEFLYNLDGMDYEAAVIRIGIGAFFVKFGFNTPEAMKKLIAEPVPQHVEFKDFLAFYGHALYEKPALPEPEVEDVTDEEIEELREEQFEWSKDPSHIIGLDAKTDEEVLEEMQTEFEDDLRISGVKDWQHYLMGYMNTRMLHDAMNTNAASVQDTNMYEKAMNDVQRLRMRMVLFRIQVERLTGIKLEDYEWDLRGDMIQDLINERIKAIENSPARQRHAESRVLLDKLERHRQNERKSMRARIDGMEPQVIAERKQALALARHDLVATEASVARLLYKQQEDIRALLTEDLRQLNERLLLEELDTEAKRKKALEPPKDEWYPLDQRLKASRAKRTEIAELFERMQASQRDFDTSGNHLAFLQFAKRSEKALIKYVKLVTNVYKTANRTKHDAVAEVFVKKIAEAQKDYLVAAGNFRMFIKEHEIHFEWANNLPRQVRMLLGRAIKSMRGNETADLETFLENEMEYMQVVEPASNEEAIFVDVNRLKTLYKDVLGDEMEEVTRHGAVAQVTHTIEGNFVMIPKEDDTKISFDDMTILLIRVMTYERDVSTLNDALLLLMHWKRDKEYFEKVSGVIRMSEPNDEEAVWAQAIRFYVHGLTGTHTFRLQHLMLIENVMRKAGYNPRLKTIGYLRGTLDKLEEHKERQAFFEAVYRFLVAAPETRYQYVLEQYAYAYFVALHHCWKEDIMSGFVAGIRARPKDLSLFASAMVELSTPHAVNPTVLPASVAERSRFETYAVDVDGKRLKEMLEHLQDIYDSYAKAGKQMVAQELRNLLEEYVGIRVPETDDIQLTFEQLLQATYRINERNPATAIHFFALVLPRLKQEITRLTKD